MNKKPLTPEQLEDLHRLAEMPDDQIDLTDIPEVPEDRWALAFRPGLHGRVKRPVALRLDADILRWFERHSAGGEYQSEINRVLREHILAEERKARS